VEIFTNCISVHISSLVISFPREYFWCPKESEVLCYATVTQSLTSTEVIPLVLLTEPPLASCSLVQSHTISNYNFYQASDSYSLNLDELYRSNVSNLNQTLLALQILMLI
jgi:hypothetical protein